MADFYAGVFLGFALVCCAALLILIAVAAIC